MVRVPWMSAVFRFWRCAGGATVVEFALLAPVLFLAIAGMADLGFAVASRMELDRNVRAGAQAAMLTVTDPDAVRAIVLASASGGAEGEQYATQTGMTVTVENYCACGDTVGACNVLCPDNEPPSTFCRIRASRIYDASLLPDFRIDSDARVQVR